MTRWNRKLVCECRNRAMVKFGQMTPAARMALIDSRVLGVVEYYAEAGWHQAVAGTYLTYAAAYRLRPSFNPMSKK